MEAPEKLYFSRQQHWSNPFIGLTQRCADTDIEYVRKDAFIENARKWFEMQNEGVDFDGNYKCDMTDFEDFKNYMYGIKELPIYPQ